MNNKDYNKEMAAWICESCNLRIETTEGASIKPLCPVCQKPVFKIREIKVSDLVENSELTEFIDLRCKDDKYPSKRKLRRHLQGGVRKGADGRIADVRRRIDVGENEYEEKVIDLKTGELIRNCGEPLNAHRGRGSVRKKKNDV